MKTENLRALAPDLNRTAPRSPGAPLTEFFPAVAARLVDKCRADLLNQAGAYHYNCPMDRQFFSATGLDAVALREFIATGADDLEIANWMRAHSTRSPEKIAAWSRRFRSNPLWRILDLEDWLHERWSPHRT